MQEKHLEVAGHDLLLEAKKFKPSIGRGMSIQHGRAVRSNRGLESHLSHISTHANAPTPTPPDLRGKSGMEVIAETLEAALSSCEKRRGGTNSVRPALPETHTGLPHAQNWTPMIFLRERRLWRRWRRAPTTCWSPPSSPQEQRNTRRLGRPCFMATTSRHAGGEVQRAGLEGLPRHQTHEKLDRRHLWGPQ